MTLARWVPLVGVALAALGAAGEPIEVSFSGTIESVPEEVDDGTFTLGAPVSGSFQIDPDIVDAEPGPDVGRYDGAVSAFTVTFGAYEASDTSGLLFLRDGMEPFTDEFYVETSPTGADVANLPLFRSILLLFDTDRTLFSSDEIPEALDLAEFEHRTVTLEFEDPPFSYPVVAEVTSLDYEPAPQPAGALSLAAGALALGLYRLSRRR